MVSTQHSQRDKQACLGKGSHMHTDLKRNSLQASWLQPHFQWPLSVSRQDCTQASPDNSGCVLALLLSAHPAVQHTVLIKKGGLISQPGPEPPIHHHLLISPKCLSTVEVQNAQTSICPGPSFCITAGACRSLALCSSSPQG